MLISRKFKFCLISCVSRRQKKMQINKPRMDLLCLIYFSLINVAPLLLNSFLLFRMFPFFQMQYEGIQLQRFDSK